MPNAKCILPSRRRPWNIPRDGVCPAESGRPAMTSPIIKTWPEFVNALCSMCCFWPTRRPLQMTADLRRARSIPSSSLPHALSRPSSWGSFSPPRPRSATVQPCPSILTLDQVSRGRVGRNIVTTADAVASLNFGMTEMPSSDLRYEMAAGFSAAVRALWDSWDNGAWSATPTPACGPTSAASMP